MEKLIFINSMDETIELTDSAPFLLQKVEGLGSPPTRAITSKGVGQDGETYYESSLDPRDIRIEAVILAKENIGMYELRRRLNKVFNPKLGEGTLTYINDFGEWNIKVASIQAPVEGEKISSSQAFMLHLRAYNPYWRNTLENKTEIALWVGDLEFPVEIMAEGMEFGHRLSNLIANIYNEGDASCGMRIEFKSLATVINPSLVNINTNNYIKINMVLEKNDRLIVNTVKGNKKIELIRNNAVYDAGNRYDLSSEFLQLSVGDNRLRYDAEEGIDNLEVSIYYRPLYSGI